MLVDAAFRTRHPQGKFFASRSFMAANTFALDGAQGVLLTLARGMGSYAE